MTPAPDNWTPEELLRHAQIEARELGRIAVANYEYLTRRTDLTHLQKGEYQFEGRFEPTPMTVEEP